MIEPISCQLGVFRLSESDWATLATNYPSYIGQSGNVPDRWRTYLLSATDFRKHKNALDKLNLKGSRVLFRLLDWGLADKESLDNCERCQIALWKPSLNKITYGFSEEYCQIRLNRKKSSKIPGIYQLIVVPLALTNHLSIKAVATRDAVSDLRNDLKSKPDRLKGYVPLKRLKFFDLN